MEAKEDDLEEVEEVIIEEEEEEEEFEQDIEVEAEKPLEKAEGTRGNEPRPTKESYQARDCSAWLSQASESACVQHLQLQVVQNDPLGHPSDCKA